MECVRALCVELLVVDAIRLDAAAHRQHFVRVGVAIESQLFGERRGEQRVKGVEVALALAERKHSRLLEQIIHDHRAHDALLFHDELHPLAEARAVVARHILDRCSRVEHSVPVVVAHRLYVAKQLQNGPALHHLLFNA